MKGNQSLWECPRCRSWHGPNSLKCDCKPVKRDYCKECLKDAYAVFNPPFPSLDTIEQYAEEFHTMFHVRQKGE